MSLFDPKMKLTLDGFDDKRCFFCQDLQSSANLNYSFKKIDYTCSFCGKYSITLRAKEKSTILQNNTYFKLGPIAAELKLQGEDGYTIGTHNDPSRRIFTFDSFQKRYPENFGDLLDRALWNIARLTDFSPIIHKNFTDELSRYFFYCDFDDARKILYFLREKGYIDFIESSGNLNMIAQTHLTLHGYDYIRKLQLRQHDGNCAFVAMWFEKSKRMDAFKKAVNAAVNLAGYQCDIINEIEHNNYIMDEVLNHIGNAKFVIADFTCAREKDDPRRDNVEKGVRGGVYFEAGFAKGKGKTVICTCCNDNASKRRRHFDIDQINTIFWSKNECTSRGIDSLAYRLYHRIIRTIGQGPCVVAPSLINDYSDFFKPKSDI